MKKTALKIICCLITMLIVISCGKSPKSSQTTHSSKDKSGLNLNADVDPAAGTVVLPADRYMLSDSEQEIIDEAGSAATAECARKHGLTWTGWRLTSANNPASRMWNGFGPWTKAIAQKFAFALPMGDGALIANGIIPKPEGYTEPQVPNTQLSDEEVERVGKTCQNDPQVRKFDVSELTKPGPWSERFSKTHELTIQNPQAKKIFNELRTCYAEKGMTFSEENPGFITAADSTKINEEQINLALKVAECQESINATPRLVKIMANTQAPIIEKYSHELTAQRSKIEKILLEAKKYTSTHPELFQ